MFIIEGLAALGAKVAGADSPSDAGGTDDSGTPERVAREAAERQREAEEQAREAAEEAAEQAERSGSGDGGRDSDCD